MEQRKEKEIEYYDEKAEEQLKSSSKNKCKGDFEGFEPRILSSFAFCYQWLKKNCQNKIVLDYGCGNGIHSVEMAKFGVEKVIGIDLSEKSLAIAKQRVKQEGLEHKTEFLLMDCEAMSFPDNSFDIIFDGGAFSSLDIKKVFPELARVLKPDGILLGIETFGHNPLANLKRKINKIFGKRTDWAESHIFKIENIREAEKYFNKTKVYFFHLISFLAFPFLNLPCGKIFLKFLEKIDKVLFLFPFLRKYGFKIVFIFSQPKK